MSTATIAQNTSEIGLPASIKFSNRRQAYRALENDMQTARQAIDSLRSDIAELVVAGITPRYKAQFASEIARLSALVAELSAIVEFAVSNPDEAVGYYLEN